MKSIVVPKNKQAEIDLDYDKADSSALITWNLSNYEFKKLNSLKVFDTINDICDVLIDEYEDKHIFADKLPPILKIYSKSPNPLINKLITLFSEAIERKISIHFYF